jgi:hypothetical protein
LALTGFFAAPAKGQTPVTSFSGVQYTGAIQWKADGTNHSGPFEAITVYTAEVTLTAASGWTFAGVTLNGFTHTGASRVGSGSLAANGTVTLSIEFPQTATADSSMNVSVSFGHDEIPVSGYADILFIPPDIGPVTLSVTGYTDVAWYLDDNATPMTEGVSSDGASITLNGADYDARGHRLIVVGTKNGMPYSRILGFIAVPEFDFGEMPGDDVPGRASRPESSTSPE